MLDAPVRRFLAVPLDRAAGSLQRAGLGPNSVTFAAFMFGLLAIAFTGLSFYFAALIFLALHRFLDLVDGAVARRTRITPLGGFLDVSLGYIVWGGLAFAFVLSRQQNGLAGTFLILGLLADAVTCIAGRLFAVVPEHNRPMPRTLMLSGHTETFLVFAVMMLVPWSFGFLPYLYGVLCFITAGARIASATAVLEPPAKS